MNSHATHFPAQAYENKDRLGHLDTVRLMVTRGGFEPPMRESKSLVLPLHYRVIFIEICMNSSLTTTP